MSATYIQLTCCKSPFNVVTLLGADALYPAGVVNGDTQIQAGDILVLFGLTKDIQKILEM